MRRLLGTVAGHAPSVTALASVRRRVAPDLNGMGDPGHVALTFDDGPDPASTPSFLAELRRHGVRATFFVLGSALRQYPALGRAMAEEGHELAVHGWVHRPVWSRSTAGLIEDLTRTRDLIATVADPPEWFRPPYGVLTAAAVRAAGRVGLRPVLWSCWGREWGRLSTLDDVRRRLGRGVGPGATVLLHDARRTPGWPWALAALPALLAECDRQGLRVGPLREHGVPATTGAARRRVPR